MKDLLTITDLSKRWRKSKRATRDIVRKHRKLLLPTKIGREQLFDPANIKKFEEACRVVDVAESEEKNDK